MFKVSLVVVLVLFAFSGLYSILSIAAPKLVVSSGFEAAPGKTLDSIQDDDFLKAYIFVSRTTGIFGMCVTIAGVFIFFKAFRKKAQWAWWSLLIVACPIWIWGLVNAFTVGDTFSSIMYLVGTVLLVAGLLLSAKTFFAKKPE